MDVYNVRQLKNNPSEALRSATRGPVLVMKGDHPAAWILPPGLAEGEPETADLRLALAAALFREHALSLGRAAQLAGISLSEMISHLSRLGISINDEGDTKAEVESLEQWLASS